MMRGRAYVQGCELRDGADDRVVQTFASHQAAVDAMNDLRRLDRPSPNVRGETHVEFCWPQVRAAAGGVLW